MSVISQPIKYHNGPIGNRASDESEVGPKRPLTNLGWQVTSGTKGDGFGIYGAPHLKKLEL